MAQVPGVWWHQAITWINVDLSLMKSRNNQAFEGNFVADTPAIIW